MIRGKMKAKAARSEHEPAMPTGNTAPHSPWLALLRALQDGRG